MNFLLPSAVLASLLVSFSPAQAQDKPDWAQPYTGDWTLSGVSEGDPYCLITLMNEGSIGGARLNISATCMRNFPLYEVIAWSPRDDSIIFTDHARQPVLTLEQQTQDSFGGELTDGRMVSFDRGGFDQPALEELMDGTFSLSGYNGKGSCGFMVEATSSREGTLEQAGDCPDEWTDKGWSKWEFDSDKLKLLDGNGTAILTLTREDAFTFSADGYGSLFFGPGSISVSE